MTPRLAKRVLLVGWDAADWRMILPLVQAGQMPAVQQLLRRGVRGNVTTLTPILSPLLWTSIATGKRADKHGILGFIEPDPVSGGIRPVASTSRKCKALWNILTQEGLRTHVVGWFASHPVEPIQGVNVSNSFTLPSSSQSRSVPLQAGSVHPKHLEETFAALRAYPGELLRKQLLPLLPKLAQLDERDPRPGEVAAALAECLTLDRVTAWILENENWDFLAVYYNAIDHLCHHFMPYHPPRREGISAEDFDCYHGVITAIYRYLDTLLGRLLHLAGPDTAVLLVSDHGFYSDERRPPAASCSALKSARLWHRPHGIVCAAGPPFKANELLYGASILDITPTVLTLFGLPIGQDMDGRPLLSAVAAAVEPSWIPSWEATPGACGMHPAGYREDPWEARDMLRQLADLGYISLPEDDTGEALRLLRKERVFNLAVHFLETGRPTEAVSPFEDLLREEPANVDLLLYIARCRFALGEFTRCRELLAEVLQRAPDSPHAAFLLGKVCAAEDQHETALTHFRHAEQLDPRLPTLSWTIGQAYLKLKSWTEAEHAFRKALELDRDSAHAHLGLAHVLLIQNRFENAAATTRRALELNYHLADAHFVLGIALARLGQAAAAVRAFETCLAINPLAAAAHKWLAVLHAQATGDQV